MKIPLLCDVGEDSLSILHNSNRIITPLPFKPRLYAPTIKDSRLLRKSIGTRELIPLEIIESNTISEYEKLYISESVDKPKYIEQVYSEMPDYFLQYPNTDDLRIISLDIETLTHGTGIFPRAEESPILAIGIKYKGKVYIYSVTIDELDMLKDTRIFNEVCDDRILRLFVDKIIEIDPDIIATYNGIKFDMPYIFTRMKANGIDPCMLSRYDSEILPDNIPGRIHWDMWRDVEKDQTLLGLPNRRLKTIGHHFGWSDIIDLGRDAMSNTSRYVGTPELEEYLSSDLRLTEQMTDVYINNHISLGEMMGIPLRETINSYSSLIPKIYHIRNLKDKWIGLKTNSEKYSNILSMRYEAAMVAIYDSGRQLDKKEALCKYFPEVWKVDFASQYPTAIITFNLSPETCYIHSTKPYQNKYEFKNDGKYLWLNLPDANAQKQVIIKVDISKPGFLRSGLLDLKSMRSELKRLSKGNPEDKDVYSKQWAIKVVMNSIYGYEGLTSSRWGDLSVAIATVGICRWLMMETERHIGNSVIAVDTDGAYISTQVDIDEINKYLSRLIVDTFGVPCEMELELDECGEGYFYRAKNYLLRMDGKISRKGNVFKSSKHSQLYSKALDIVCAAVLDQVGDYAPMIRSIKDWSQYKLTDYIMSISYKQDPEGYTNPNAMQPTIARLIKKELEVDIGIGDSIDYIVTKGGAYTPASLVTSLDKIDYIYYENEINKIFRIFNISTDIDNKQMELF